MDTYISGAMPKDPNKKRVEAHLSDDAFKQLEAEAKERQWSNKKLAENIILWYLEAKKPAKKK